MPRSVSFTIVPGDILTYQADVIALKYAQYFYGVDEKVATALVGKGVATTSLQPPPGRYRLVDAQGVVTARRVLFVGVPKLREFRYQQIQQFSRQVLQTLRDEAPDVTHVAMTTHGAGYGLDEVEAIQAEFAGLVQALQAGEAPSALEQISIVERNADRVQRLRQAVDAKLVGAAYAVRAVDTWAYSLSTQPQPAGDALGSSGSGIERVGTDADAKPVAFVAMPFQKETDDTFYYGIQGPVRTAGLSCERIDHAAFTGSIFDSIKQRIERAAVVIAELSTGNPNVYLEIGYAWGKGRPTILLTKNVHELPFDVRGHKCLQYETLRELEGVLTNELMALKAQKIM